jgi:hypothetical protein
MTKDEAEVVLYLVDKLLERGATNVDVMGVRASFAPAPGEAPEKRRKEKTYHERLFGRLPPGAPA